MLRISIMGFSMIDSVRIHVVIASRLGLAGVGHPWQNDGFLGSPLRRPAAPC